MIALLQTEWVPEIPLADWVNSASDYITERFDGFFDVLRDIIDAFVEALVLLLTLPPEFLMIALLTAIAFFVADWRVAVFTALGLFVIVGLGLWEQSMETLALTLAATVVSLAVGIPIGILAAKRRGVETFIRPVLDIMQTLPAFVYLVPVVVLLSTGNPPALIATFIFATPPAVRLTMLGIQQVPSETVEAAHAFGSTPWQTLAKVELPLSLRSIMAGVNQVIMLSLSMAVIAGLVGFGGLGEIVVAGLGQLNVGEAMVGGVGIVILAIILDRVTRGLERRRGTSKKGS
jgi:glycine betaine/proline transport system permease protein